MDSQVGDGEHQEGAGGAEEAVGQQTCGIAVTQQRQWERNAQGRWQATIGQFRWTCKEVKALKKETPGAPAPKPKAASSLEGDLKKHIVAAKDLPALQTPLQTALLA
eukprot:1499550-Amphidinium_carterae.1